MSPTIHVFHWPVSLLVVVVVGMVVVGMVVVGMVVVMAPLMMDTRDCTKHKGAATPMDWCKYL